MRNDPFEHKNIFNISKISFILLLIAILIFSVSINYYGNRWGAPDRWHPDELTERAEIMVHHRSLNPGVFYYGGLHYLTISATAVIPAIIWSKLFDRNDSKFNKKESLDRDQRTSARIIVFSRTVSAIMGALIVLIAFWIGDLLFDRWVGLLAALFLSLSSYFITVAHFATVDTAANFWYWLSCLMAVLMWKRDEKIWYFLAFLVGGLAIGTKIDRLIVVIPLLVAHFSRGQGVRIKLLLKYMPLLVIGYIIANPTLIITPFRFLDGMTRDTFFNILRGDSSSTSFIAILRNINTGLGTPLFLSALGGMCFAFYDLLKRKKTLETLWLVAAILPYYLLFGSRMSEVWYTPFFFPALTIFAAFGYIALIQNLSTRLHFLVLIILLITIGYSALCSIAMVKQFTNDSRYLSSQWITQHIKPNSTILISPRGPRISGKGYAVVQRPYYLNFNSYKFSKKGRDKLDNDKTYQRIRHGIFELEKVKAKLFGTSMREQSYHSWFDISGTPKNNGKEIMDWNWLLKQHYDYIILVDYLDKNIINILSSNQSKYRLVKTIHYESPFNMNIKFPFINPKIFIFQRRT